MAVLACLFGGALVRAQEPPAEKAAKPPKPVILYRVDFAIHELEDGQRVNTRNYTQLVEEGGNCRVRAGHRMAITTPIQGVVSTQYLDVGLRLDCRVSEGDGYVRLEIRLDITYFAQEQEMKDRPLLRNISAEVQTAVPPGKPTVVTSIDDTVSKRRYELEVTATKMK